MPQDARVCSPLQPLEQAERLRISAPVIDNQDLVIRISRPLLDTIDATAQKLRLIPRRDDHGDLLVRFTHSVFIPKNSTAIP